MSERMETLEQDRSPLEEILGDIQCAISSTNRYVLQGSYRELSLAKTKLEEAEMWLSKLIKEGGKYGN